MTNFRVFSFLLSLATGLILVAGILGLADLARASYNSQVDYFVSSTGSGSACSQANPCSLDTAVSLADDGTNIFVGA